MKTVKNALAIAGLMLACVSAKAQVVTYEDNKRLSEQLDVVDPLDVEGYLLASWMSLMPKEDDSEKMMKIWGLLSTVKVVYSDLPEEVIGKAQSPMHEDAVIVIDPAKWVKLTNVQRLWLTTHESLHEVLGMKHGEGGPLMFPIVPSFKEEIENRKILGWRIEGHSITDRDGKPYYIPSVGCTRYNKAVETLKNYFKNTYEFK